MVLAYTYYGNMGLYWQGKYKLLSTPSQVPRRVQDPLNEIKQESLSAAEVDEKYISVSIYNNFGILW